jgi:hypothetical protein
MVVDSKVVGTCALPFGALAASCVAGADCSAESGKHPPWPHTDIQRKRGWPHLHDIGWGKITAGDLHLLTQEQ